jgi:replicative DNA helicase
MKYGASSSILILDYDLDFEKFRVIKRIEVPKSEYSYDNAVNLIVELNDIYNPSWIYVDRGSGKYNLPFNRENRLNLLNNQRAKTVKAKFFEYANTVITF